MILPILTNVNSMNFGAKVILDARSKELAKLDSSFRKTVEKLEQSVERDVIVTRSDSRGNSYGDYCSEITVTDLESGESKNLGDCHDYSDYADIGGPCFYPNKYYKF